MSFTRICIAAAVSLILLSCGGPPSAEEKAQAKAGLEERIATVINLSGNLCAKVDFIGPVVSTGEYQVNCEEYRNPKLSKTKNNIVVYMVNPDTNSVRYMGRG
jgi:hypothetical protein